jgi:transposase-like protein
MIALERSPFDACREASGFRRRAPDLVRLGGQPVAKIAKDPGISESCLRRWMSQEDVDAGRKEGPEQ